MSMPKITSSNITKCQAITDIIQSVALMETALSHIVNSEGEKIQRALGTLTLSNGTTQPGLATSTTDLLNINKSVENMLGSITLLESLLQKKLSEALDVDCSPTSTSTTKLS